MDSTQQSRNRANNFAKKLQNAIRLKSSAKNHRSNPGFCLLIPPEKLRCCESHRFEKDEDEENSKEETRNRAAMAAFVAKVFATVSAVKAAYAELQLAQFPYDDEAIQSADQKVVDELKALSELKYSFLKKQIDPSPPHVILMLAEIQEQQSLMKTYEITMKKMQGEVEKKEGKINSMQQQLEETVEINKSLERKMNASGPFSVLDSIKFSGLDCCQDFVLVLNYCLRSVRCFVKLMIREMEGANWDIEAAAKAIQPDAVFVKRDHRDFAFESFVCRGIFSEFNDPEFSLEKTEQSLQLKDLRCSSTSTISFLKQNPNSEFGKFLKLKYLHLVHPKMEFSFSGNLNQRKMVNAGQYPETEFFKAFAEMGRRVWLLNCLACSFDGEISAFQVKRNSRFSEVYMEAVTEDVFTAAAAAAAAVDGGVRVAFTVVPGFKVGRTVVQSQVYLFPASSRAKS